MRPPVFLIRETPLEFTAAILFACRVSPFADLEPLKGQPMSSRSMRVWFALLISGEAIARSCERVALCFQAYPERYRAQSWREIA